MLGSENCAALRGSQEPALTATAADYSPVRPLTSSGGVPTTRSRCAEGAFFLVTLVLFSGTHCMLT